MKFIVTLIIAAGFGLAAYYQHQLKLALAENEAGVQDVSEVPKVEERESRRPSPAPASDPAPARPPKREVVAKPEKRSYEATPAKAAAPAVKPDPAPVSANESAPAAGEAEAQARAEARAIIDGKIDKLDELRVKWDAELSKLKRNAPEFREQRIMNGKMVGTRTSEADRRKVLESYEKDIQRCEIQLAAIKTEREKLEAEWIELGR